MLRLCAFGLLVFVVAVSSDDTRHEFFDEGVSHTISVFTLGHNVVSCFVDTPNDGTIEFSAGDVAKSTAKYTILAGLDVTACMVTINNINSNDAGDWAIYYTHATGVGRTQPYHFTVTPKEPFENEDESSESDEADDDDHVNNVKDFTIIRHRTVEQAKIDISLNKESFEEECYIEAPNGALTKADEFKMDNVIVQPSSKYVSCRITISPVVQASLGDWRVCGKSTVNDAMRCQPVSIEYNRGSAQGTWDNWVHDLFSHPVHFGGSVNPGVLGNGNINTCNVVTPQGEDLVITTEIKYPHIERSALDNPNLCSVIFTDIDSEMIGEWQLYGTFDSIFGLNQVSLPLEFYLYNENNPHEQAHNVTVHESRHIVNLGTILTTKVSNLGSVVECQVTNPSGQLYDSQSTTVSDGITFQTTSGTCQVSVGPITETMLGEWRLVGKFNDGPLFSEHRLAFDIIREDPANPIQEEHRTIQYLPEQVFDTHMDTSHRVVIQEGVFHNLESCHLQTPDGLQYSFIDGFNVPNVEIINEDGVDCGVIVHVASTDVIGDWTLISRTNWLTSPIERRLPFSINVEVNYILPNNINIREGSNLHLRLDDTITTGSTCELFGPDGEIYSNSEIDTIYANKCGFIVRGVTKEHNGTWAIRYGSLIMTRATVEVTIIASESAQYTAENQVWTLGGSINQSMGPEDAVYCKIEDTQGLTVYDGFGQCLVNLDRVMDYHQGTWTISVGSPGTIVMQEHRFYVTVRGAEQAPIITTSVSRIAPAVILTCSLPAGHQVRACKFRDVNGNTMVVQHGVGDQNGYGSEISGQDCILRLNNPTVSDLGLWRCAMDTEDTTHYAFITVTCPWLMQDPLVAASVVTEPVLSVEKETVNALEGDPTVLRCSVPASIRYCYFRASNGAIYNVGPAISSPDYEYVGSGLHSGECGIRFHSMVSTVGAHGGDGRQWRCNVGLMDVTAEEQSASMTVEVKEKLSVTHHYDAYNRLIVEATVHDSHPLDYCRFIRINGQGFTQHNAPDGFSVSVSNGHCIMYIDNPNILDIHPWTVVAKLTGVEAEISKYTAIMAGGGGDEAVVAPAPRVGMICLWVFLALLGVVLLGASLAMIPKKNREWAGRMRNSFRRSPAPVPAPVPVRSPSLFKEPLADPPKYQETA